MTKVITSCPLSSHSAFFFPAEQWKLETVKMTGAHSKINAISLNVKINKPKSVDTMVAISYKLPINVQNSVEKRLGPSENIVENRGGGYFFDSPH